MASVSETDSLLQSLSSSLLALTRTANSLAAQDLDFHRSLNPSTGDKLDIQNALLLDLAGRLVRNASSSSEAVRPKLTDAEAVDDNWRGIVDVLDSLLEKADTSLDEYTGALKRLSPAGGKDLPLQSRVASKISQAIRSHDLLKPQLSFQHVPKNDEVAPFRPMLHKKPHALIGLEDSLHEYEGEDGTQHIAHPYQSEIEQFNYPSSVYTKAEPILYTPFESTSATFVDTEEGMYEMLEELKKAQEIAVDLEHHDQRSYVGMVSLMQISTRNRDWIVDTLKPWRRKLEVLNEVFTDPSIVKVLHGAKMDAIWLQRDLGLYLVGLFDTHCACRALGYSGGGLAFLLKKFVNFDAQKQYQMADWRVRPLPKELFDYARSDTHFLLYIFDNMRNELLDRSQSAEQDKIAEVLDRSKEVALQTYEHPMYDQERGQGATGWYRMLYRNPTQFSKEQFSVFRAVHEWRDRVAREEDESIHFVLANHSLFSIAKELPGDKAKLLSAAQPLSQSVRVRADELLQVVRDGIERGATQPEMRDVLAEIDTWLFGAPSTDSRTAQQPSHTVAMSTAATGFTNPVAKSSSPVSRPGLVTTALRSLRSKFWGNAVGNHIRKMQTWRPSMMIPLPPLTAEIVYEHAVETTPRPPAANRWKHTSVVESVKGNEVDSDHGSKHKRSPPTRHDKLAVNEDEVGISPQQTDEAVAPRAAKRRRKAEGRAAERTANEVSPEGALGPLGVEEEEEEFDYANATSVLEPAALARPPRSKSETKKVKGAEAFTLSSGLGDVKKGLGRRQKDGGGRSMTFKK